MQRRSSENILLRPLRRRQHRRARLDRKANFGEVVEERLSIPASRCQASTSASNMFQATRSRTTVPTRALVVSRPLATSVLTLSRNTGRDTAEHRDHFGIAGQARSLRVAAGNDVNADRTGTSA